jgi:uridylate kinase
MTPTTKKPVVISLGGSILNPRPGEFDIQLLLSFSDLLRLESQRRKIVVVCGGGSTAREYIRALPSEGITEGERDIIGIMATWMNARLLSSYSRGLCSSLLPRDLEDLVRQLERFPVAICGGFLPALKTDEDAAITADFLGAELILNITDVDGVYDKIPQKHPGARKYDKLSYDQFCDLISHLSTGAGAKAPFTMIATRIAQRSGIKIIVLSPDPENIKRALAGEQVGTLIGA